MSFIVETQDGSSYTPGANSYASDTDATTYFNDRGITTWSGTQAVMQAALVRATQYLDARYKARYQGSRLFTAQSLGWPRRGAIDRDFTQSFGFGVQTGFGSMGYPILGIPTNLRYATFEAALIALGTDLMPFMNIIGSMKAQQVGGIKIDYQGDTPSLATYQFIDTLMRPLLHSGSRVTR